MAGALPQTELGARPSVLFTVRPRTPNIGNEVIAIGMHALLERVFGPRVSVASLPAGGTDGVTGAGLTARTIYDINQLADGVVVGPGNLFENGGLDVDAHAISALNVPAVLFSVSMGRIFDRRGQLVPRTDAVSDDRIRAVCAVCQDVLVRDEASRDHLNSIGCSTARVVGCPSLFLGDALPRLPVADVGLADAVLVSIRHPRLMSVPHSIQGRIADDVRRIIDHFRRQGMDVRLLCHDYRDLPFAQSFPDVQVMYSEDPWRFLSWLRDCRLNVTFRLHAFLPCLVFGTPSVPITYDERAMSLIEAIGFDEWATCCVRRADVLGPVQERCESLEHFVRLERAAQPVLERLREAMTEGMARFAHGVTDGARLRRL